MRDRRERRIKSAFVSADVILVAQRTGLHGDELPGDQLPARVVHRGGDLWLKTPAGVRKFRRSGGRWEEDREHDGAFPEAETQAREALLDKRDPQANI